MVPGASHDLTAVAARLPLLEASFDAGAFSGKLLEALAGFDGAGDADREDVVRELAEFLAGDPWTLVHLLLSREFRQYRADECFLLAVAYAYFLLARLDDCLGLCVGLFEAGVRRAFLLDMIARCRIAGGDRAGALELLEAHEPVLRRGREKQVLGRLAGLNFIEGRKQRADALVASVRDDRAIPPHLAEKLRAMEAYMTGAAPARPPDLDFYADEANHHRIWNAYAEQMHPARNRLQNASLFQNMDYLDRLRRLLDTHRDIRVFVNFGAMYGAVDHRVALEFPGVRVVGYDISPVAAALNRERFRADNLVYVSGDFAEVVAPLLAGQEALLGHSRTATMMGAVELAGFYRTCHQLGLARILAHEPCNWSILDWRYPDFREAGSALMFGQMMAHDYPRYLEQAGYHVKAGERNLFIDHQTARTLHAASGINESLVAERL